jgi:hypothetical protein
MPSSTFIVSRNDRLGSLVYDTSADLTGATTPKFVMRGASEPDLTAPKIYADATLVDAPTGVLQYDWVGTDTDTTGVFIAEFVVWVDGKKFTMPSSGTIKVVILRDIG